MKLMGFNFTKINAERTSNKNSGEVKINTNVDITDIKEAKSDFLKSREELLAITFNYKINYNPDIALIEVAGNLVISVDSKQTKTILRQWKDKKLLDEFRFAIINLILRKSTLKTLELEEELNIPTHIPMPALRPSNQEEPSK